MACSIYLCICLLLLPLETHGWWPFGSSEETTSTQDTATVETRQAVQFEISSAEQKFLTEAQQFLDLPQLDQCQHVVISRLRSSCGEMYEEELGKLAVELLNCQSRTEGRPTFPCTQDMILAECTGDMDASTWNTYHIISNRARSVCYATRQDHFKRQTEMAVNQLSQSTLQQLSAMQELASSHQQIKQMTTESLESMQSQADVLSERQDQLTLKQDSVRDKITTNLEQLAKERGIISNGQRQLVNMTDSIRLQLEEASELLSSQEKSRKQGQSEIIEDLSRVRDNIQQVWTRVDSSTSHLLRVMADISTRYESTLDNLDRINSSVGSMMHLVVSMDQAINGQLDWLIGQLGGAQDGIRILTLLTTHAAFLLMATLCVLFVKAPAFARVTLLALVCVNVFMEVHYRTSLTFAALAALEALIITSNWLYLWVRHSKSSSHTHQPLPIGTPAHLPLSEGVVSSEPVWEEEFNKVDEFRRSSTPVYEDSLLPETISHTPVKQDRGLRCTARTRMGSKCRLPATPGESRCRRHI